MASLDLFPATLDDKHSIIYTMICSDCVSLDRACFPPWVIILLHETTVISIIYKTRTDQSIPTSFSKKWSFFSFLVQEDSLYGIQYHRSVIICVPDIQEQKAKKKKNTTINLWKRNWSSLIWLWPLVLAIILLVVNKKQPLFLAIPFNILFMPW